MQVQAQTTGRSITLREKTLLAEGGEARIYLVPHDRSLLAKIYKNPNPQRVRRLPIMLANPPAPAQAKTPAPAERPETPPACLQRTPAGLIVHRDGGAEIELVLVKPGRFVMGADDGSDSARPTHWVRTQLVYLARHEVTQAQWLAVMGTNPANYRGPAYPATDVRWTLCQEFARRLTARVQRDPIRENLPGSLGGIARCRRASPAGVVLGTKTLAGLPGVTNPCTGR